MRTISILHCNVCLQRSSGAEQIILILLVACDAKIAGQLMSAVRL